MAQNIVVFQTIWNLKAELPLITISPTCFHMSSPTAFIHILDRHYPFTWQFFKVGSGLIDFYFSQSHFMRVNCKWDLRIDIWPEKASNFWIYCLGLESLQASLRILVKFQPYYPIYFLKVVPIQLIKHSFQIKSKFWLFKRIKDSETSFDSISMVLQLTL